MRVRKLDANWSDDFTTVTYREWTTFEFNSAVRFAALLPPSRCCPSSLSWCCCCCCCCSFRAFIFVFVVVVVAVLASVWLRFVRRLL
jgi:hypothetical protein